MYKAYLHRASPTVFRLPKSANLQWVGINGFGTINCDPNRQIPMWRDQGQRYCTSTGNVVESKPSVLNAISLGKSKTENTTADVSEDQQAIPNEESAPTE